MPYEPTVKAPNPTIQAIFDRQSCRCFAPDEVEDETIKVLAECAQSAPSACNMQNINIFVLKGVEKVAEFGLGIEELIVEELPFMKGIAMSKEKMGLKSFVFYDAPVAYIMTGNVCDEKACVYLESDCGHYAQSIMIGAKSLGLDSICVGCTRGPKTSVAVLEYLKKNFPSFPWEEKGEQRLLLSVGVGKAKVMKAKPSRASSKG
ncbi:hypothetical protein ADUPG1_006971 [Aduncisulcus paluster]|uniref:Nitroreductase domain-containing protein n=1 Tax=Aduncisulcus paluster TaxID=2918883 RepID=A0ABQ5KLX5_9EUKA|nr:hypothetical protein ADUPG1_006971 [Aduncisulcus paluster]